MCLQAVDSLFLQYLVHKMLEKSASVHLLFAFEYVILASAIVSTFLKYTAVHDRCLAGGPLGAQGCLRVSTWSS